MGTPANTNTAYSNATTNVATLKELYSDDSWVLKDLVFNRNPGLALIDKDETEMGLAGKYFPIPVMSDTGAGRSANFGNAQTYQTAPQTQEFNVTRVQNYSLATLTGDFLRASAQNIGAFMPGAELNVKSAFQSIGNDLAHDLFLDGSGQRGTYGLNSGSGSISSGVITLDAVSMSLQFGVGMALVSYSVSGQTPTQSTSLALGYVIAVDTSAGTVTVSATQGGAAGTPTNWSTSFPYLAQVGDVNFISNGLSSANMLKIAGFGAWIPSTAPSGSDNFFGVNRSVSPTKLAGLRFSGSNESIQDALIDSVNQLAANGSEAGDPDFIFINPTSYQVLVKQLTSQGVYQMIKAKINDEVNISFKALVLPTANGEIAIIQDRNCPAQTAYIITLKTWKLRTLGKCPQFLTYPGFYDQLGVPLLSADGIQLQIGYYGNLTCNAPGANAVVTLAQ
jgi:hypothetical protein